MFKYALMDYLPQRYLRHLGPSRLKPFNRPPSFEAMEADRYILDFKSGRKYASEWASRLIGKALLLMD